MSRTIKIKFILNSELENRVNDHMIRADLIPRNATIGVAREGIVTTSNKLPLDEYRDLIAKGFEENGGALLEMSEIATPKDKE